MIHKTKGVVLRFTRYGETSIIVNVFTETFGLQSYIVNGIRSSKAKARMALYQPLTLLDMVVYHKENGNVMRLKEVKCLYPFRKIPTDISRQAIALFIIEILSKAVREQSHPEELYGFLERSFIELDTVPTPVPNFHLFFLINLSRYLGFGPQLSGEILGGRVIPVEDEKILQDIISSVHYPGQFDTEPLNVPNLKTDVSHVQRRELLDILVRFYKVHIDHFGDVKSMAVLREVLG